MSRTALSLLYIASFSLSLSIFGTVRPSRAAIETIVIGGVERLWSEGGGGAGTSPPTHVPQFRLTPRTAGSGNAPGGVIDFQTKPGWILPTQIDPERNLFELIREQGGAPRISSPNVSDIPRAELENTLRGIINGSETVYVRKSTPAKRNVNPFGEHIDIDLGALFGIERIRFFPSAFFPGDFLKAFRISLNDGSPATQTESGNPLWTEVFREDQNVLSDTNVNIPLQFVRHIRLTALTTVGFEIDEIELYGRGFVPSSRFLSDVFDLGQRQAVWGSIRWSAEAIGDPNKSRIFVRTRSGRTPTPLIFTRLVTSLLLSQEPFRFELGRISYDRAAQGIDFVLAPVELPELTVAPAEYDSLSQEIRDWLEGAGANYAVADDAGVAQTSSRPDYEAAGMARQEPISLPAAEVPTDAYRASSGSFRNWLQGHDARYFRRANIGENAAFGIDGKLLTESTYNRLALEERGPILEDTQNWSPWSAPFPAEDGLEGTQIPSPAPRRFFQFEIRFQSEDLEAAQRLDFLSFEVSAPPLAQGLVGEIFPRDVGAGQSVEFTYAVRPSLDSSSDLGFDSFAIQTPVPIQRLVEVQILDPEGRVEAQQSFGEPVDELVLPFQKGDFTLVSVEADRFQIAFPKIATNGSLLKLRFVTAVLRFGTTFQGWGLNTEVDGLPQPVFPGDVAQLGPGDAAARSGLTVFIDLTDELLSDVRVQPNPFTPNNDGINDRTQIQYDLLKLTDPAPVSILLYDLSGRRIRTLHSAEIPSGRYAVPWDGRDENGQLVLPGIYLFEVSVKSDDKSQQTLGTVAVAY